MEQSNEKVNYDFNKVENELFKDKRFIKLLEQFKHENQKKSDEKTKFDILKEIDGIVCSILGIPPHNVILKSFLEDEGFKLIDDDIYICMEDLKNDFSPFLLLEDYFVELRLQEQIRVINSQNDDKSMSEELYENIIKNYTRTVANKNIEELIKSDDPLYNFQPKMLDANEYGERMIYKSIDAMMEEYGKDVEIENYLIEEMLPMMGSYEEEITKAMKIMDDNYDLCTKESYAIYELLDREMPTPLNQISDEILYCILSPIFQDYLSDNSRQNIVNEFVRREAEKNGLEIKNPIRTLDSNELCFPAATFILNELILENIETTCKYMKDKKMANDLLLNLAKDENGKKVNIISAYCIESIIQPIAMIQRENDLKYLKLMNDAVKKNFKEFNLHKVGSDIIVIDDEKKLKELTEKYYDKPFVKVYEHIIDMMRINIERKPQEVIKNKTR